MKEKELEKIVKYQDLELEVGRVWHGKTRVISIYALGIKYRLIEWLAYLRVQEKGGILYSRRFCLEMCRILRKICPSQCIGFRPMAV